MSISIIKRPERFSPSSNPIIFQISTTDSNIVYFRVRLIEDTTTTIINDLDIFPTPDLPKGSYIDLHRLLDDVVGHEMNNFTNFAVGLSKPVKAYRLKITERLLDTTTSELVDGASYDVLSDVSYVYHGDLTRSGWRQFDDDDWVMRPGNVVSFLTNKPDRSRVNDLSAEHLYFLQDGSVSGAKARVRFYSPTGTLLSTISDNLTNQSSFKMYRLNVSPKALKDSHGINFTNVGYYTVDVVNASNTVVVGSRTYIYEPVDCGYEYVNVLWTNGFGGVDSYQFIAPQEANDHSRFQIKRNIYHVNDNGYYSDDNNGILNPSDVLLTNKPTTTVKLVTKNLSDAEAYWFTELFRSKQTYVETNKSELIPTLLVNTNYSIPRVRYNRDKLNTTGIELKLSEGVNVDGDYILTQNTVVDSLKPTPTPTISLSATAPSSPTPTPTNTATNNPTPTPTPTNASYNCSNASFSGSYAGTDVHTYPDYLVNVSTATSVTLFYDAYDRPNQFEIRTTSGTLLATSSWVGHADYAGPWGASLNVQQTGDINATVGSNTYLIVRVYAGNADSANPSSDSFTASLSCS